MGEARLGPAALAPLANDEQCDSHCLMGGSPVSPENNWAADGRWIDNADYDHLIDKLAQHPDPEIVFVSGMIIGAIKYTSAAPSASALAFPIIGATAACTDSVS